MGWLIYDGLTLTFIGVYVDIEMQWVTMNATHVIAASKNNFIVWQYKTPKYSTLIGKYYPSS